MGQLSSQQGIHMTPAKASLLRSAAPGKEHENSLNRLYDVVRAEQPQEGSPLSPQQVELICNVIGKLLLHVAGGRDGCIAGRAVKIFLCLQKTSS